MPSGGGVIRLPGATRTYDSKRGTSPRPEDMEPFSISLLSVLGHSRGTRVNNMSCINKHAYTQVGTYTNKGVPCASRCCTLLEEFGD